MSFRARAFRSSVARRHLHNGRRAVVVAHVPQTLPPTVTASFWCHVLQTKRSQLNLMQNLIFAAKTFLAWQVTNKNDII